jgi:hypothetical protein
VSVFRVSRAYRLERASEPNGSRANTRVCFCLRFLDIFVPSISAMHSNPLSISCDAPLRSLAVLHV